MNLIDDVIEKTFTKRWKNGEKKYHDCPYESTKRLYSVKRIPEEKPLPKRVKHSKTSNAIDTHVFRFPKEMLNPCKIHYGYRKVRIQPHENKRFSFGLGNKYAYLRIQNEYFPAGCKPWELVADGVRMLVEAGYFVVPVGRVDVGPNNQRTWDYWGKYQGNDVRTVADLYGLVMEHIEVYQVDWFKDRDRPIEDFFIKGLGLEHESRTSYYLKGKNSRIKLYDRKDKGHDVTRFEVSLFNGKVISNYKEYTMEEMELAGRLQVVKLALHSWNTRSRRYWLWVERFLYDGDLTFVGKVTDMDIFKGNFRSHHLRRETYKRYYEILKLLLKGCTYREIERRLKVSRKTISKVKGN